ncbi:MAG: hypothetical protein GY716_20740 [bacterium]|nr:hypothetical protein [bacterium]
MNKIGFVTAVTLLIVSAGCSGSGDAEPVAEGETAPTYEPRSAATLDLPSDDAPGSNSHAAPANHLVWSVPDAWTPEPPRSDMRYAQYVVPGADGPGECVVYYFGPGQGGDPMANARRWAGQFTQPDGSSSLEGMKITSIASAIGKVQIVEVHGTYDGGMTMTAAPADPQPNSMLLGAIAPGPDAPWFFKLTGPESTIEAQRSAFVGMLQTLEGAH